MPDMDADDAVQALNAPWWDRHIMANAAASTFKPILNYLTGTGNLQPYSLPWNMVSQGVPMSENIEDRRGMATPHGPVQMFKRADDIYKPVVQDWGQMSQDAGLYDIPEDPIANLLRQSVR